MFLLSQEGVPGEWGRRVSQCQETSLPACVRASNGCQEENLPDGTTRKQWGWWRRRESFETVAQWLNTTTLAALPVPVSNSHVSGSTIDDRSPVQSFLYPHCAVTSEKIHIHSYIIITVGESSSIDIVLAFRWSLKWIYFVVRWSIIGNSLAGRWSLLWPALFSVDRSSETVWRGDDRSSDRHFFPLIDHRKNKPVCCS